MCGLRDVWPADGLGGMPNDFFDGEGTMAPESGRAGLICGDAASNAPLLVGVICGVTIMYSPSAVREVNCCAAYEWMEVGEFSTSGAGTCFAASKLVLGGEIVGRGPLFLGVEPFGTSCSPGEADGIDCACSRSAVIPVTFGGLGEEGMGAMLPNVASASILGR